MTTTAGLRARNELFALHNDVITKARKLCGPVSSEAAHKTRQSAYDMAEAAFVKFVNIHFVPRERK